MLDTSNLKDFVASRHLLSDHTSCSNHGEAAIVELLCLHRLQLLRILGLEAQWVKAQVAWLVVFFHCPRLTSFRILEAEDRKDLRDGNGRHDCGPESLQRCLLESNVSRHINVAAKEWVELLAHKYAKDASIATRPCFSSTSR